MARRNWGGDDGLRRGGDNYYGASGGDERGAPVPSALSSSWPPRYADDRESDVAGGNQQEFWKSGPRSSLRDAGDTLQVTLDNQLYVPPNSSSGAWETGGWGQQRNQFERGAGQPYESNVAASSWGTQTRQLERGGLPGAAGSQLQNASVSGWSAQPSQSLQAGNITQGTGGRSLTSAGANSLPHGSAEAQYNESWNQVHALAEEQRRGSVPAPRDAGRPEVGIQREAALSLWPMADSYSRAQSADQGALGNGRPGPKSILKNKPFGTQQSEFVTPGPGSSHDNVVSAGDAANVSYYSQGMHAASTANQQALQAVSVKAVSAKAQVFDYGHSTAESSGSKAVPSGDAGAAVEGKVSRSAEETAMSTGKNLMQDPTFAGILKSIGFDFDLSKKMQEKAREQEQLAEEIARRRRKEKTEEEMARQFCIDKNASFLGGDLDLDSVLGSSSLPGGPGLSKDQDRARSDSARGRSANVQMHHGSSPQRGRSHSQGNLPLRTAEYAGGADAMSSGSANYGRDAASFATQWESKRAEESKQPSAHDVKYPLRGDNNIRDGRPTQGEQRFKSDMDSGSRGSDSAANVGFPSSNRGRYDTYVHGRKQEAIVATPVQRSVSAGAPQETKQDASRSVRESGTAASGGSVSSAGAALSREEHERLAEEMEERRRRLRLLEGELDKLRRQQNEMMRRRQRERDGHKDPLIAENARLQEEIGEQIAALRRTAEANERALSARVAAAAVAGTAKYSHAEVKDQPPAKQPDAQEQTQKGTAARQQTPGSSARKKSDEESKSYEFFDGRCHWCKPCNIEVSSLQELLEHLHTKEHLQTVGTVERPWVPAELRNPAVSNTPKKSTSVVFKLPLKGAEFLMPATEAFFCRLCSEFVGDQRCAEAHVKSTHHYDSYQKYTRANQYYERRYRLEREASARNRKRRMEEDARLAGEEKRQRLDDEMADKKLELLRARRLQVSTSGDAASQGDRNSGVTQLKAAISAGSEKPTGEGNDAGKPAAEQLQSKGSAGEGFSGKGTASPAASSSASATADQGVFKLPFQPVKSPHGISNPKAIRPQGSSGQLVARKEDVSGGSALKKVKLDETAEPVPSKGITSGPAESKSVPAPDVSLGKASDRATAISKPAAIGPGTSSSSHARAANSAMPALNIQKQNENATNAIASKTSTAAVRTAASTSSSGAGAQASMARLTTATGTPSQVSSLGTQSTTSKTYVGGKTEVQIETKAVTPVVPSSSEQTSKAGAQATGVGPAKTGAPATATALVGKAGAPAMTPDSKAIVNKAGTSTIATTVVSKAEVPTTVPGPVTKAVVATNSTVGKVVAPASAAVAQTTAQAKTAVPTTCSGTGPVKTTPTASGTVPTGTQTTGTVPVKSGAQASGSVPVKSGAQASGSVPVSTGALTTGAGSVKTSAPAAGNGQPRASVPAAGTGPVKTNAAAAGTGPVTTTAPAAGPGPVKVTAPAAGPGPVKASAPAAGPGPVKASAPAAGPGPVRTNAVAAGSVQVKTSTPASGPGPVNTSTPAAGTGPVKTSAPAAGAGPVKASTPAAGTGPVKTSAPATGAGPVKTSTPAAGTVPVKTNAPAAGSVQVKTNITGPGIGASGPVASVGAPLLKGSTPASVTGPVKGGVPAAATVAVGPSKTDGSASKTGPAAKAGTSTAAVGPASKAAAPVAGSGPVAKAGLPTSNKTASAVDTDGASSKSGGDVVRCTSAIVVPPKAAESAAIGMSNALLQTVVPGKEVPPEARAHAAVSQSVKAADVDKKDAASSDPHACDSAATPNVSTADSPAATKVQAKARKPNEKADTEQSDLEGDGSGEDCMDGDFEILDEYEEESM